MNRIILGDNLMAMSFIPDGAVHLCYIDPPFNTHIKRVSPRNASIAFEDTFEDYIGDLRTRIEEVKRVLAASGSLFVHVDPRESHYVKVMLDEVFGRSHFMNEIIWSYDYGARSKTRWPAKHDTIFYYVKNPKDYTFNYSEIDRIPYMAPALCGPEKAARGKTLTDVWWNSIVHTNGKERTGYPTQKPLAILERIIKVHSNVGDTVLDCYAGSGTTGEAAVKNGRHYILIDSNPAAISVIQKRLKDG